MRALLSAVLGFLLEVLKGFGAADERARRQAADERKAAESRAERAKIDGMSDAEVDAEVARWTRKP